MKTRIFVCAVVLLGVHTTAVRAKDCAYNNFAPESSLDGDRSYCVDSTNQFVQDAVWDFGMDPHWDGEWSGSAGDVDSPKCVVLEAVSVLERASAFAPDESALLKDAYRYSADSIRKLKPSCSESAPAVSGVGRELQDVLFVTTGNPFSYTLPDATTLRRGYLEAPISYRAAILRHEAAHRQGRTHLGSGRDRKYENWYEVAKPSVHSQTVDWLIEYIALDETRQDIVASDRPVITKEARLVAVDVVNDMLANQFNQDPGFRINVPDIEALTLASANGTTEIEQRQVYMNSDFKDGPHAAVLTDAYVPEACGLTRIAGDLQRTNEWVYIAPVAVGNDGLALQSLDVRNRDSVSSDMTRGWAQCFPGKVLTTQIDLTMNDGANQSRDLGPEAGQACFVMGLGGITTHNSDRARVSVVNGRWLAELTGTSSFMRARFGCIPGTVTEVISAVEDENKYSSEFISIGPEHHPDPVSCVLSEVYGRFRNTKSLAISLQSCDTNTDPNCHRYMLDVDQNTLDASHRIGGSMTCFSY